MSHQTRENGPNEFSNTSIAFVVPCYNEALTVTDVVKSCKKSLPQATVYVFDNNSTDTTAALGAAAGATVVRSPRPGKGEVMRHAFNLLQEDVVIMLDGDGTYDTERAPEMVRLLTETGCDMVVCNRVERPRAAAYPRFHTLGNRIFSAFVGFLLGRQIGDVFSGYRAFSRRFFESVAFESRGFELESELTLKAASYGFDVREISGGYGARPEGSHSKLHTFRDGFRILRFIVSIMRDCRPLFFFSSASLFCFILSIWSGIAPIMDYVEYHYVYTVPRAVLAASLMILSMMSFAVGVILDSQNRMLRQQSLTLRTWLEKHRVRP